MEGGCTCRQVRYGLTGSPLIVHACHCTWCQRATGSVHALNALYEADRVVHLGGEPELIETPSASGRGQRVARCPWCKVAVWSNYPPELYDVDAVWPAASLERRRIMRARLRSG